MVSYGLVPMLMWYSRRRTLLILQRSGTSDKVSYYAFCTRYVQIDVACLEPYVEIEFENEFEQEQQTQMSKRPNW